MRYQRERLQTVTVCRERAVDLVSRHALAYGARDNNRG